MFLISPLWAKRRLLAGIIAIYISCAMLVIWINLGFWLGLLLGVIALFRIFNLSRIIKGRMHTNYLRRVTRRTSLSLYLIHVLALIVLLPFIFIPERAVNFLMIIQLLAGVTAFVITAKTINKLRFKQPDHYMSDAELPTVTVAIPARNETTDLEECLRAVIANNYPKLEIIVLDDCSQGKTADIIRSFAHDGVRFVPGDAPAVRWLAKNQAYQKLYEESSGDLILFIGVDARLGQNTIRSMVNLLNARKKSMLSVLPIRRQSSPAAALIQPMRYWWELALPRRLFNKPPVLSTCWMIGRSDLEKLGGFKAVSHAILPEVYFAREMVKTDQYSFIRSTNDLDVSTVKSFHEQYETAIRTRYPQIRRRPEWALFLTFINLLLLLSPFIFLALSFWLPQINFWIALITCVILTATHVLIVHTTDPANSLLAAFTFPVDAFIEMLIGYVSMIQYEFYTVEWKGRNICIPVMHVVPKLPKL